MTCHYGVEAPRYEPDWARSPPHVAVYPNPPNCYRVPAEMYTSKPGVDGYQRWWSKWERSEQPSYRFDPQFPLGRQKQFTTASNSRASPTNRDVTRREEFLKQGTPFTETKRAEAIYRSHFYQADDRLYQRCNAMTSTQYKRPVNGVHSFLRNSPSTLTTSLNRHSSMPYLDMY